MKKMMTIEDIANAYMDLFASTGRPYYFMMYRSLSNLADNTYDVEINEEKTEEDTFTL